MGQRKDPRLGRSDSSGKARSPVYYVKSEDEMWQVAHILERRCEEMLEVQRVTLSTWAEMLRGAFPPCGAWGKLLYPHISKLETQLGCAESTLL